MNPEIEKVLKNEGISPTPIRTLVYKCLMESDIPLSLSDIEISLDSVDKSSVSRTLNLFRDHHLVHVINDGSGSMKYEVCCSRDHKEEDDMHVHFRCETCGKTICLTTLSIPQVQLPKGYIPHETSYVITGVCSDCNKIEL